MKIKNFEELAVSDARKAALAIAEEGFAAIDTAGAVKHMMRVAGGKLIVNAHEFNLAEVRRLYVVGVGKCSLAAGSAIEEILGDRITDGVVIDVRKGELKKIRAYQGTHPLPTDENMNATKQIIHLLDDCEEKDLVIFIVSGGGSTLLCQPTNHLCAEEADIFTALSALGATIQELNTVRKHLSLARGGYLAQYAYPARSVALIFSDVPGNDVEFVASGPTVKDTTTVEDAKAIVTKYQLKEKVGFEEKMLIETPKENRFFGRVVNVLVVSNEVALRAMADEARRLGYVPKIMTTTMSGEADDMAKEIARALHEAPSKSVLLYGGETTVNIKGGGKGGRNLEIALAALRDIREGELILSLDSDGRDNGPFAGAICDTITMQAAVEKNMDIDSALRENESYPFFEKIGHYLSTGDTGSNVSDLIIAIKN